jgi:hypothetical protein
VNWRVLYPHGAASSSVDDPSRVGCRCRCVCVCRMWSPPDDFYNAFLGNTMVYTSGVRLGENDDLETMQLQKVDLVCQKIQLKRGERLLDIGCGWGTLSLRATDKYGVSRGVGCRVPCAVCRVPCAVCRVPCAVCRVPCAVCGVLCAVCCVLCAVCCVCGARCVPCVSVCPRACVCVCARAYILMRMFGLSEFTAESCPHASSSLSDRVFAVSCVSQADVTGVTLSSEQVAWATEVASKNSIRLPRFLRMDYRDIPKEKFNKVTCLEMAEHVGVKNFTTFLMQVCVCVCVCMCVCVCLVLEGLLACWLTCGSVCRGSCCLPAGFG